MTGMLASVTNLDETRLVMAAGVDIIDLKNPRAGALGALDLSIIKEIVTCVNGVIPLSATIGDLPFEAGTIEPIIRKTADSGVDIVKVGVFGKLDEPEELNMLAKLCQQGIRIVLVLFAEKYEYGIDFSRLAKTGITGVMLDTMDKRSGTLRAKLADSVLQQFVLSAKVHRLLTGLAGSLEKKDIDALLKIAPDYLGFRGALCQHGKREDGLDQATTEQVRRQIPSSQQAGKFNRTYPVI